MKDTSANHWEIPEPWGWYRPRERLAGILIGQLRSVLPEGYLVGVEMIAYHQDRDHVLLRRGNEPSGVMAVHANPAQKKHARRWPIVFDGTFLEFTSREQKRHVIEQRMIEESNEVPGICPACFATFAGKACGGIWTGSFRSRAPNGPMYDATCTNCRALLIATPTCEESEAGVFLWLFSEWEDDAC